jgi:Na+(H+)/acetate symporter ActP
MSPLETAVVAVVAVVIFYVLLGSILAFTWNRSVTKVFGTNQLDVIQALFLLVTMHILFGTFSHCAYTMYNTNNSTSKTQKLPSETNNEMQ